MNGYEMFEGLYIPKGEIKEVYAVGLEKGVSDDGGCIDSKNGNVKCDNLSCGNCLLRKHGSNFKVFKKYMTHEYLKGKKVKARVGMSKHWDETLFTTWTGTSLEFNKINPHKEETMKKAIEDNFEKTKDANLVQDELGDQITDNFIQGLVVKQYAKEILAEAKRIRKEREDK